MSLSEESLRRMGWQKLANGEWRKPSKNKHYEADRISSSPKPERPVRDVPLAKASREERNPTRRKVCIVSFRKRLIDPDNLCPKYFIDALRYRRVLTDDTAKHITLEVRQEKSDNPRTEITID